MMDFVRRAQFGMAARDPKAQAVISNLLEPPVVDFDLPEGWALACHTDGRETHPDMQPDFAAYCNCLRCCEARWRRVPTLPGGMVAVRLS